MLPHDIFNLSQLPGRQTVIRGQQHNRFQPKFGNPCRTGYVNVGSNFFPAVEKNLYDPIFRMVGDIGGAFDSIYPKL
jgi:hypothetical protein